MPLIEGIGDEVVQFFALLLIFVVGLIAWLSTGLSDRQIIRTVLILERRSRHRIPNDSQASQPSTASTSLEGSIDTGQAESPSPNENREPEAVAVCHTCDKENRSSAAASSSVEDTNVSVCDFPGNDVCDLGALQSGAAEPTTSAPLTAGVDIEESPSSLPDDSPESTALRRRRLAFFQSRQATLLDQPDSDQVNRSLSVSDDGISDFTSNNTDITKDQTPITASPLTEPSSQGNIRIRLKYLNEDQKMVEGRLEEQLGEFKRRHFALEIAADKLVRLIFNGHVLQSDNETLQDYGLFDNCVVHCLVHRQRSPPVQTIEGTRSTSSSFGSATGGVGGGDGSPPRELDLGNILFASLGILLGLAWYCRYQYSQLFNATTTVALVGLTGILTVSLVGVYLPDPDGIRHRQ